MTDSQINFLICEITGDDPHWKCAKDYCNDLNAMHEAEKSYYINLHDYGMCLYQVVCPQDTRHFIKDRPDYYIWHATARQRAEAFLRTLGKWEEAK